MRLTRESHHRHADHKTHLFYEPQYNPGPGEPVTFRTDFGVTFGMLVCFDLSFGVPATDYMKYVRVFGVCASRGLD